jgi:hypothetical protein
MLGLALGYEKPTNKVSRFGILDYREGYQTLKPWYPCGYLKKNQISDLEDKSKFAVFKPSRLFLISAEADAEKLKFRYFVK